MTFPLACIFQLFPQFRLLVRVVVVVVVPAVQKVSNVAFVFYVFFLLGMQPAEPTAAQDANCEAVIAGATPPGRDAF